VVFRLKNLNGLLIEFVSYPTGDVVDCLEDITEVNYSLNCGYSLGSSRRVD
jgi:hypothetical protein